MIAQKTLLKVLEGHSECSTVLDLVWYSYIRITVTTQFSQGIQEHLIIIL